MTDATRFLAQIETELHRGGWSDPGKSSVLLVPYAEAWLAGRDRLAPRTRDLYGDLLRLWIRPDLGQVSVGAITPGEVRRWHSSVGARTGPTRTRQAYSLLRAILNEAVRDGLITINPCQIRGAGQVRTPERALLEVPHVYGIADAIDPRLRPLVLVTFWAQLRIGEVLALRVGDVDLDARTLRVQRQLVRTKQGVIETEPKAASVRTIHLPDQAVEIMQTHLSAAGAALPSARLFVGPDGRVLQADNVQRAWRKARAAAGQPDAHFHDLRHAGLTLFAQLGATTKELMVRGGHKSPRAALIYQHSADTRQRTLTALMSEVATPTADAAS